MMMDQRDLLASLTAALRRERIEQQLTQEDLAAKAQLSPSPVRRLEQGQGVQLSAFLALIDALGLSERLLDLFPDQLVTSPEVERAGVSSHPPPRKRVSRIRVPEGELRSPGTGRGFSSCVDGSPSHHS